MLVLGDRHTGLDKRLKRRAHIARVRADQIEAAAGDRGGAGIAARLDAIGHDAVGRAVEPVAALDLERLAADSADRSEERRVGKECVSTCRSWWSPYT